MQMTRPTMTQSFDPSEEDGRLFRNALGQFATGVTIVTCDAGDGPLGITANSFSSLSLDPPLVLWSPAKQSSRYPFFAAASHFAIHVLGHDQADLCTGFARNGDAFDMADWVRNADNVPLINGCLARFECKTEACHDGGDHTIMVGRVQRVSMGTGAPLMFHAGRYGQFAAD